MSCTKDMLSVIMDGIKDADMLIYYAKDAEDNNEDTWANWFIQHAKTRVDALQNDFAQVMRSINIEERIRNGDDIAEALKEHLDCEIDKLNMKLNR